MITVAVKITSYIFIGDNMPPICRSFLKKEVNQGLFNHKWIKTGSSQIIPKTSCNILGKKPKLMTSKNKSVIEKFNRLRFII